MMKKKILAAVLALCMLLSMSTVALAEDDGAEATAPVGGGAGASTGVATVEGATFDVTGDDDNTGADATDPNDADISLWGRITTDSTDAEIVYKLVIVWGSMRFVFTRPGMVWNPSTHTYETSTDATGAGWSLRDDYDRVARLDGSQEIFEHWENTVGVTSHSNHALKVVFNFEVTSGAFNADPNDPDRVTVSMVKGYDKDKIDGVPLNQAVSERLTDVDGIKQWTGVWCEKPYEALLDTAESYSRPMYPNSIPAGERYAQTCLVPSGTPDESVTMSNYTRLGTLTITFEPDTQQQTTYTELNGIPRTPQTP